MVCSLRGDFFYRIGPSGGRRCARHYMGSVSLGTGSNRTDIGGRSSGPWAALAEVGSGIGNHGGFKSTSAYVGQRQTAAQTLGSDLLEVVDGTKAINHLEDVVVKAVGAILHYGVNRTAILWIAGIRSFGIKCAATRRGPDCGRALRAPVLADTTWVCGEVRMVDGADRVGR
jgi:hypothetical protein